VQAERHLERHDDGSTSIEWILYRRRLVVRVYPSRDIRWFVANLTVEPWRESSGSLHDMGRALADFLA
jgi:hypothetical protein